MREGCNYMFQSYRTEDREDLQKALRCRGYDSRNL